ncbi:MAG: heparinase II/III family protein [Opitutaceae bacterium]|jgi:hypothetical protein
MINLLQACPSCTALARLFREQPPVSLLPPLADSRWAAVFGNPAVAKIVVPIVDRARLEIDQALPVLTDEAYRDFAGTGVRLRFEHVYFERRRQLARAAVALLAEPKTDCWRRSFLGKLEDIFAEESWALPAHVKNDTGRDSRCIDLFAAETANLMGECLNVFGTIIPSELQACIRSRLRHDFFENYRDHTADCWWSKGGNNWNAVCHQGVLGAALAVEDDPDLLAALCTKAAEGLPVFLAGYGADGGCSEGPGYWVYGFGWFSVLNEQLETRTQGRLSLFSGDAKVQAIARYGPAVTLAGQNLVNFADASGCEVLRPSLLEYLGRRLHNADCRQQALENYQRLGETGIDLDFERADLFFMLRLFLHWPAPDVVAAPEPKSDIFFKDLEVWVVRGRDEKGRLWELAAKGGFNEEHHNHNDLGSFILNVDGVALITEIGAPEYTRDFFRGETRYSFIAARSLGHSLPVINGQEQANGVDFKAKILRAETSADTVTFEVDLTGAYPAAAHCRKLVRTLTLAKSSGELRWTDVFELDQAGMLESAIISDAGAVVIRSARLATIERGGITLSLQSDEGARWDRVETHSYRGHAGGQECSVRRLVLVPERLSETVTLGVTVRL